MPRQRDSSPERHGRSVRDTSSVRRPASASPAQCSIDVDRLPVSYVKGAPGRVRSERRAGDRARTSSPCRCFTCSAKARNAPRCCCSSTTRNGSTVPRWAPWLSSRADWSRTPSLMIAALRDGFESPFLEAGNPRADDRGTHGRTGGGPARRASRRRSIRGFATECSGTPPGTLSRWSSCRPRFVRPSTRIACSAAPSCRSPPDLERAFADRLASLASETAQFPSRRGRRRARPGRGALDGRVEARESPGHARGSDRGESCGFRRGRRFRNLRFRHPLMRSAIQQAMSLEERRATHAALAATLMEDPDRNAGIGRPRRWEPMKASSPPSLQAIARRANGEETIGVAMQAPTGPHSSPTNPRRRSPSPRAAVLALILGMGRASRCPALPRHDRRRARSRRGPAVLVTMRELVRTQRPVRSVDGIPEFVEIADRLRAEGEVDVEWPCCP